MIRINLLPVREEKRKADVRKQLGMIFALIGLVLIGAVLIQLNLKRRTDGVRGSIVQLEAQLTQYKEQLVKVEDYRARKEDIEAKLGVIQGLERSRTGPVHMLDELAAYAPDRLWLTELTVSTTDVSLSGMSLDNERVAQFLTALEKSLYFAQVELAKTEFETVSGLKLARFQVDASLSHPEDEAKAAEAAPAAPTAAKPSGGV